METSFVCGELISYFLRSFNHPEVECLCLYNKVVAVRNLFLNLSNFLAWESWNVNIVRDACNHEVIGKYIHKVQFDELMQTLDLPIEELEKFASDVLERFDNPYVDHQVTSIMLNSFPKFCARDLPGVKTYLERKGELPKGLVFGLAAIITYYKGGKRADGAEIVPNDDQKIMDLLKDLWETGDTQKVADGVLGAEFIWGEDLNKISNLNGMVKLFLDLIQDKGMLEAVKTIL